MTKKLISGAALAAAAMLPVTASAVSVVEDKLEVYGVVRLSVDYYNADAGGDDTGVGVSSNTSLFGIRGKIPLDGQYTALYQLEQSFLADESGGNLATRDSFLGFDTPYGKFLAGYMDTPFKTMGLIFTNYSALAADPHAILGAASTARSPGLDSRGKSAIKWQGKLGSAVRIDAMYSTGSENTPQGADDNDSSAVSGMALWSPTKQLRLGAAYVKWSDHAGQNRDIEGARLGAAYRIGQLGFEAIVEDLDSDEVPAISRLAYGLNAKYQMTPKTAIGAQWMHADESDVGDDEADQIAVVLEHALHKQVVVHALASTTRNGDAARYKLTDWAHGDKIQTVAGGSPYVFSVGAELKF